jgi:Protein of unknown function (DUF669)
MAQLNFDASTVAPNTGTQDAIPAGWYNVQIDQSELKPTKDASGAYLELRLAVLDGQYAGRKVFSRLNLRNNNPQAVEIAFKDLSAICHAVGVMQVQDSSQLHGKPMKIKVSVRAATGEYEASNEVKAYKNINENVGGPGAMPAAAGGAPWGAAPQMQAPAAPPAWAPQQPAAPVAPPAQFAQPQQPAAQPQQPAWQAPAAAQPWAAPQQPQAAQQPQFAAPQAPQQAAQPPQQQFAAPAAPVAPPAGGQPAWMAGVQAPAGGATPPWATQA